MSFPNARWIWQQGAPRDADVFIFARRTFVVAHGPARIHITCDGRYALCLDGRKLGRGPVRSEPRDLAYDSYDVELEPGAHVLGVLARHYGRPTLYWKPGATASGGILVEVEDIVATDRAWRMLRAPYLPQPPSIFPGEGPPDPEVIDGRAWPWGWLSPDFDDGAWDEAIEIEGPSPAPRPVPLLHERVLEMGELTLQGGEARTLDLGTITNAHVELDVDAAPGTVVEVRAGEEIRDDEVLLDVRDWTLRAIAAGVPGEHHTGFEPIGFRYLRVSADASARVAIRARERTLPREPGATFECSDPQLNAIWEAGARTLELCTTDAYIDCPSREQRAWLGDDYVNTLISLTSNPDLSMVLRDLRMHAAGQRADGLLPMVAAGDFTDRAHTLPDGSLLWVATLARVYEHTGDVALVAELLPVARRILDRFESMRAADGLIAGFKHGLEGWVFIDWAQIERGDHIATLDAMYAMALRDGASLYGALGGGDEALGAETEALGAEAAELRARHAATAAAFERYWDPSRGCYVDAAWLDGRVGRRVSQHANSAAICAALVQPERAAGIVERITDPRRLKRTLTPGDGGTFAERLNRQWEHPPDFDDEHDVVLAQPFFTHFLHRALVVAGRHDLLVPSIQRWSEMVARNGLVEEYWDALPGLGSRCHSWAGTPTYDLVANVLGVRAAAPGWSAVTVEPHLGELAWAQASVPTPRGFVRVRAERGQTPSIELPPGMTLRNS